MRYTPHTIFILLAWLAISQLCVGCSTEDIQVEVPDTKGTICLRMSSNEVYVQTNTRTTEPLKDFNGFTFTLNDKPIDLINGQVVVEAGTYTLSATNANAVDNGYSAPLYSGDTTFVLYPGERKNVTLDLGTPKNAMVSIVLSEEFSAMYELTGMQITDGTKSATLTSSNSKAYFPAIKTTLNYTIEANAKSGSHVQDIISATGTITIEPGTHTPVILKLNPIDSNLIIIESGDAYSGEFQ